MKDVGYLLDKIAMAILSLCTMLICIAAIAIFYMLTGVVGAALVATFIISVFWLAYRES